MGSVFLTSKLGFHIAALERGIHQPHASVISSTSTQLDVDACGRSEFCDKICADCPVITAQSPLPHLLLMCLIFYLHIGSSGKKLCDGVIFQEVNLFVKVNH